MTKLGPKTDVGQHDFLIEVSSAKTRYDNADVEYFVVPEYRWHQTWLRRHIRRETDSVAAPDSQGQHELKRGDTW